MNIAFCDGMLLQLDLSTSNPNIVSKQGIGTATIDFYNYFSRYRSSPKEEFLNLLSRPDKKVLEIISEQSLANQFFLDYANSHQCISTKNQQNATKEALTYTCNLIQNAPMLIKLIRRNPIIFLICSKLISLQRPLFCWIIKLFWYTRLIPCANISNSIFITQIFHRIPSSMLVFVLTAERLSV